MLRAGIVPKQAVTSEWRDPGYSGTPEEIEILMRLVRTKTLPDWFGDEKANVLFFGLAGSGKSTLINTAFTCLTESPVMVSVCESGSNLAGQVTKAYRIVDLPNAYLKLHDVMGYSKTAADAADVIERVNQRYMTGQIKHGARLDGPLREYGPNADIIDNTNRVMKQAALVLTLGLNDVEGPAGAPLLADYVRVVARARAVGALVVIALTKTDSAQGAPAEVKTANPMTVFKSPIVAARIKSISSSLGVPECAIFPIVSPTQSFLLPEHRAMVLDMLAYINANIFFTLSNRE